MRKRPSRYTRYGSDHAARRRRWWPRSLGVQSQPSVAGVVKAQGRGIRGKPATSSPMAEAQRSGSSIGVATGDTARG
jgi:hypothetical protein